MISRQLRILNELGLHARVASRITRCCAKFNSRIEAIVDNERISLKNVLGVMTMDIKCGGFLDVEIEGEDEEAAASALELLFAGKFGES